MLTMRIDHYFHDDDALRKLLQELRKEIRHMSAELDALKAAVAHNTEVDSSVVTLVNGLAQQLRDMADDATELADLKANVANLAGELEASNRQVADVVTANTPAAPNP